MKIGIDTSLDVCRDEGYSIIEFKKKELLDKDGKLKKDAYVNYKKSNPEKWKNGKYNFHGEGPAYYVDTVISFEDMVDFISYKDREEQVAKFADWGNCPINFENPTVYDLLHLASDVDSYFGLEGF